MTTQSADAVSMALFCDFENIALGVRDAQYEKFDIKPVLERLLLKGSIVVKKAYCDWDRYKAFKAPMHEANFELIEIPHVRQSGKNSADIRMVVDALDLCYTKAHVNTFVIISGDSDFSPLVSKLRENNKRVIGVGVKQSTSDLLIANCDEFIYVDDLVRRRQREVADKQNRRPPNVVDPQQQEARRLKGLDMAAATLEALLEDRDDDERVWASVLKEAIKRRNPGFNETYFGYKTFGAMLEDADKRGLLEFGRDERSSAYAKRRVSGAAPHILEEGAADAVAPAPTFAETTVIAEPVEPAASAEAAPAAEVNRRRRGRGRKPQPESMQALNGNVPAPTVIPDAEQPATPPAAAPQADATQAKPPKSPRPRQPRAQTPRKPRTSKPKKTPSGES
ncbi:MAG: NYN domain-containing protein [Gammaproteobacteria bacterium]|nr:NYN domain-containing protein [Rhodocyclaceae bacterium]MBU3909273.1 NYN domain-containing protein [Gammaproteobacteria bacterium]MBU3989533.1 NYN domain-containing protein [Gammaproteobacteria bacterium]MBU4005567.1 NYN domain-containing protein [Gammaproteobacteria bacterium]MBU4020880.1 NYN domain-containing protein [Gammaproteobacteria bacterium]